MISYFVSTPRFTVRVDVTATGVIAASSARYLHRSYGMPWRTWLAQTQRRWGAALRVVRLV